MKTEKPLARLTEREKTQISNEKANSKTENRRHYFESFYFYITSKLKQASLAKIYLLL
jgi:hypothetical protein